MNRKRIGFCVLLSAALFSALAQPALAQSVNAELINDLNEELLYVGIPITVLVEGILIYTVWKFSKNDDPQPTRENRRLEITWTIATAIILLFVGLASFVVLANPYIALVPDAAAGAQPQAQQQIQPSVSTAKAGAVAPPSGSNAVEVEIVTFQWGWEFIYPEANVTTQSELVLPANRNIFLHITSEDVIHAVHIPTLGIKQDAFPGQYNTVKTKITEPGSYQLYCAEFCGSGHSRMLATVTVLPQDEYQQWLDQQSQSSSSASSGGSAGNASAMNAAPAQPA